MKSSARSVTEYINDLPDDRKSQIEAARNVILKNLPDGYEEVMNWGMITYQVPLNVYPDTYNKKPLMYAALASQKNHMAIYFSGIYMYDDKQTSFEEEYRATGKRFDMGKSCVRFRNIDDLPLELIGKTIASLPMVTFVSDVKAMFSARKKANS
ncbi:MAG: DUF1801 domain-containing protein [Candidatus Marinimicrobia bacterium]|nr:DUF1801 domain-containing protein [Candidatus Neomarinimicrobiota bacterium]MCF7903569.1 DUF1801 domain-containing protein [Candidatus Neomarinimicrobiota bacterium]